jgi:cystathionine gamma-lyase
VLPGRNDPAASGDLAALTGDGTRCVHGGHRDAVTGSPMHEGPVLSSAFHLGLPGEPTPADFYGRADNPTWRALEDAIGALDGGSCVSFASGMAAIATVLRIGATRGAVVLPSDGYYLARSLAHRELAAFGVEIREVPTVGEWPDDALDGAGIVLLETPSNPGLEVADIAAAADAAHSVGALLAVDNTTATPLGQRPLDLGADIVVASDTKALSGHGDVVLGHITARDPQLVAQLREARSTGGAVPGPMEAWLALRGMRTLALRLERAQQNAAFLAARLAEHPRVSRVRYPGLPDDPGHARAAAQMSGFGAILSIELGGDAEGAQRVCESTSLWVHATSLGGVESMLERRRRWPAEPSTIPTDLIRLAVGIEHPDDLWNDLAHALKA